MATAIEQGRQTRARLMAAAVELIVERGWGAVTTRMVADRAGVRPGLVHYHFPSVTDLLIESALDVARAEFDAVMARLTEVDGPEGMRRVLATVGSYSATDPSMVALSEMMLAATRHQRLRDELGRFVAQARAGLTDWFRAQPGDADPEATAAAVLALLDGLVLHRLIDPTLAAVDVTGPLLRAAGLTDDEGNSHVRQHDSAPGD
ncbi:TetR/AcrR family transcriptional regulator [Nocardia otitidiscaviarum]|uniref:TetR/AcrR family transcriptional regulator n=1 Tax=Nocardia otitidiscaviarum TaxID=1823 RepID=A0A516NN86_9NOCA|nr:TetR/AcrR family transcriptional regulator [Nocardia otitidiscaviarum]MCP9619455.1 TetR/AcrR family transcriptional regulator [Nocardia otitidiscaviarum]QDP80359.1 TetR/AcrR family transcriptional regulator [Nocardia otitidiscaviarum]